MEPVRNKAKWWCVVLQCHSDSRKSLVVYPFMRGVRFFPFPNHPHLRQIWTKLIRRGDDWDGPKAHHRICSRHFIDGEPSPQNPAPTIFPWTPSHSQAIVPKTDDRKRTNRILYDRDGGSNNPIMTTTTRIDATDESHINNQMFVSQHFVGGNGPTRDHPDPLPAIPMNTVRYAELQCLKRRKLSKRKKTYQKVEPKTESSEDGTLQQPMTPPQQPTTPPLELQTKQLDEKHFQQKNQFENTFSEERQIFAAQPSPVTAASAPVTAASASITAPSASVTVAPTSRHVPVLAPPGQKAKPKPVQKHQHQVKKMLFIANHQQLVMSNLSSLWKNRKLCDAAISNGTSTVKVHKVVLFSVCPKLLSAFSTDSSSQKYVQVNFPKEVSKEALNAFAEYMYNGILDLDHVILKQLKIIAKKLNKKEFEQLCDSHLPNDFPKIPAKLPLIQKVKSVSAMTSSLTSLDSPVTMDSTSSVPTQVVNQESMEVELGQVKMETDHMLGQESEVESLAPNKSGNDIRFVICPNIKTEPVETDNNKYGYLSSSTNQVFTSTTSSSSSATTIAASTSISSVPASSTKFLIPFSQSTDVKFTRLKATHSYETPLVSDLSHVSHIGETICSQSSAMNEDSSKPLNRLSISTSSIQLPSTSTNNAGIYPVALFMTGGDNPPLLTPNAKSIDLCKTELT